MKEKEAAQFFEGVILAAQEAKPSLVPGVLAHDAHRLTAMCSRVSSREAGEFVDVLGETVLLTAADEWLTYREQEPNRELWGDEQLIFGDVAGKLKLPEIGFAPRMRERISTFPDPEFAQLLVGAQFGINYFRHQTGQWPLLSDWGFIRRLYEPAVARYTAHGVSPENARTLFLLEYVGRRLAGEWPTSALLRSLSLRVTLPWNIWFQPRYGWLDISTTPEHASVAVDGKHWGDSPVGKGVYAGSHQVGARIDSKKTEETVNVPAGGNLPVHLQLH